MELEEVVRGLRALRPREHIYGALAIGILHHYKALHKHFPIGPSFKLEKFLGKHTMEVETTRIQTIDEFRACKSICRHSAQRRRLMGTSIRKVLLQNAP